MNEIRKIITITAFIMATVFLQGCSREIKAKEMALVESLSDLDIKNELDNRLDDFIEKYNVNVEDLKIVHDLTNEMNKDKYQIVIDLEVDENEEYTKEKMDSISDRIAYSINDSEITSTKLSNVNINWNREIEDKDALHYSYKLGEFNPELQNKYIDKI